MKLNRNTNPIDILLAIFFLTVVFLTSNIQILDKDAAATISSYEVIR